MKLEWSCAKCGASGVVETSGRGTAARVDALSRVLPEHNGASPTCSGSISSIDVIAVRRTNTHVRAATAKKE